MIGTGKIQIHSKPQSICFLIKVIFNEFVFGRSPTYIIYYYSTHETFKCHLDDKVPNYS